MRRVELPQQEDKGNRAVQADQALRRREHP